MALRSNDNWYTLLRSEFTDSTVSTVFPLIYASCCIFRTLSWPGSYWRAMSSRFLAEEISSQAWCLRKFKYTASVRDLVPFLPLSDDYRISRVSIGAPSSVGVLTFIGAPSCIGSLEVYMRKYDMFWVRTHRYWLHRVITATALPSMCK